MNRSSVVFANNLPDIKPQDKALARVMYIPEGDHQIDCMVDKKPASITVSVPPEKGEEIAARLQARLDELLKSNVRPVFDFDHKGEGPASALPKKFLYVPGQGIMVDAEWTGAGRKAIENKDYSYFSPTFLRDAETGEPVDLPSSGPLGALVNDPAFREISRIAAKKEAVQTTTTQKSMIKSLVKAGLLTEDEAKKDNAEEIAVEKLETMQGEAEKAKTAEETIKEQAKQIEELKKQLAALKEAEAEKEVEDAVTAGRIAPKDEETKKFWKEQIITAGQSAVHALKSIKPATDEIDKKIITAGNTKPEGDQLTRIEAAQAKARAELGAETPFQAIWERAKGIDPEAFTK